MEPAHGRRPGDNRMTRELELLVASVSDYAVFLLDTAGHVTTWNTGAERIKGYRPEEIIGEHFRRFYPPELQASRHPEEELRIVEREGRYEEEGWRIRKDGSQFWASVTITAIRDETGELLGFGKVTRDLTSRRLAEEQLRVTVSELRHANDELEQLRRLVSSVRDYAIFMLDPGGYVATWNSGAEHLKGYTADEIIGRHFSTFYTAEDKLRDHPSDELLIAAREGRFEEEGWRVRKDGTRFWANVVITAVRNEHGVLVGFAKVTRDLTSRREAQLELERTHERLRRSNAELERFAAVAAHDLRDPLTTIAAFAAVLRERESEQLSDGGREMVEHIESSVRRMETLVEDLLRYATLDEPEPEPGPVPLAASVERVLSGLHAAIAERDAVLQVDVPRDATVLADPTGVDVVVQNLVSNALKFGRRDGPPHIAITARHNGGWLVTVRDDGPGIAPGDQGRIFTAFERLPAAREVSGSGLGLSICTRIVERAGGEIGVDSRPGRGSAFWFRLPAA